MVTNWLKPWPVYDIGLSSPDLRTFVAFCEGKISMINCGRHATHDEIENRKSIKDVRTLATLALDPKSILTAEISPTSFDKLFPSRG